ncbi:MAG: integrase family protein [Candidatus Eremiobacteraeota bacterium]|nr:integrase family protein [Candidatus Eremiobacteraeota bacterium]
MSDAIALRTATNVPNFLQSGTNVETDDRLVALWLHGRPASTIATYRRDVARLRASVAKPIAAITLADLQDFADELEEDLAVRTRARMLSAAKSLLHFLARAGLITVDVGVALRVPKVVNDPSERALTRAEVRRLIRAPRSPRDVAILHLLYAAGFRRAELCSLRWRSATTDDETGDAFVTVVGKGQKLRTVRIPASVWALAAALRRPEDLDDAPIFRERNGRPLSFSALRDVVDAATRRAKIGKPVSPHWLRHAHASHALDAGASIALVRDTLGHASIATTSLYLHSKPKDSSGKYLRL